MAHVCERHHAALIQAHVLFSAVGWTCEPCTMCAARREQLRCSYPERDAQALVEEHDEHLDTRWFELALADDIHEYLTSA